MIDERIIIPKPESKRVHNIPSRAEHNRKYKTFVEYSSGKALEYKKKNVICTWVEENISLHYNTKLDKKSYRVRVIVNGHTYNKSYFSLEQARIFRDTILKNKDRILASKVQLDEQLPTKEKVESSNLSGGAN